jgi:hypothetical protein
LQQNVHFASCTPWHYHLHVVAGIWIHYWTKLFSIIAGVILCVSVPIGVCWWCCWLKTTALTGRLALIPAFCRPFLTVWSEILRTLDIVDAVDIDVANLSRKWHSQI